MPHKVLMIGLDGATFGLLDPLVEQGVMPFTGRRAQGRRTRRLDVDSSSVDAAGLDVDDYGRSPAAHGIYDFLRPALLPDGGVFLKINDFRDNHCETIWSIANRYKRRATSLNFYGMSPPPAIDGYIISGFVPWRHLRHGTHPKELYDEVRALPNFDFRNFGMDIGEEKKCVQGLHHGEHEPWIELQNRRDEAWSELTCHLMKKDRTELTAVVLDGPDKIQHLFWRFRRSWLRGKRCQRLGQTHPGAVRRLLSRPRPECKNDVRRCRPRHRYPHHLRPRLRPDD